MGQNKKWGKITEKVSREARLPPTTYISSQRGSVAPLSVARPRRRWCECDVVPWTCVPDPACDRAQYSISSAPAFSTGSEQLQLARSYSDCFGAVSSQPISRQPITPAAFHVVERTRQLGSAARKHPRRDARALISSDARLTAGPRHALGFARRSLRVVGASRATREIAAFPSAAALPLADRPTLPVVPRRSRPALTARCASRSRVSSRSPSQGRRARAVVLPRRSRRTSR